MNQWLLDWRLNALARLQTMQQPNVQMLVFTEIDLQDIIYFAQPKQKYDSIDDVQRNFRNLC